MLAIVKNISEEKEINRPKTCEYKGATYFVITDRNGKNFIEINGERKYLDKTGKVAKKQPGTRTVTTAIESFDDIKKVQDYFLNHNKWNMYLLFTLNVNTSRRISDLLASKWSDFFYLDGKMRQYWDIEKYVDGVRVRGEQKTSKAKEIYLNAAIESAFELFFEMEKDFDLQKYYNLPTFTQVSGNYKGRLLSEECYRQNLIKASCALDYEIRSHSMRRGFGKITMEIHPNDNTAKSVLMELFNHSSEKMTNKYLGETKKREREFLGDFGDMYKRYVMEGEEIPFDIKSPVSVYDNSELRNYMLRSFSRILDMKDENNPVKLMELYNELLNGLELLAK